MAEPQRRMSEVARRELVDAIRGDRIDNDTRFAEEFAEEHGLNPLTVRSSISRLRRDLGMSKRRRRAGKQDPGELPHHQVPGLGEAGINAVTFLAFEDMTDPRLARLGAAVVLRYEKDEIFRRAVDQRRPEVEKLQEQVRQLLEATEDLTPDEKANLVRLVEEARSA